jgi:hypothetical protein
VDVGSIRNWVAFAPERAIALNDRGAEPLFAAVTENTALALPAMVAGNVIEAGESAIDGAVAVPDSGIELEPPGALCAIAMAADFAPVEVGRKVTLMRQEAFGTSVVPLPQVDDVSIRNWDAWAPLILRDDSTRFAVPLFVTVTAATALALPTLIDAKVTEAGAIAIPGAAVTFGLAR